MNQPYSVWYFEQLTLPVLLIQVVPSLCFLRTKPKNIFYIDGRPGITRLAKSVLTFFKVDCQRLEFRMADMHDEKGYLIRIRFSFQDTFEVQRSILSQPFLQQALNECDDLESLRLYLSKAVIPFDWFDRNSLIRGMYLIQVLYWHRHKYQGVSQDLFVPHRLWEEALKQYGARYGINVHRQAGGWTNHFKKRIISKIVKEIIKFFIICYRRLFQRKVEKIDVRNPFDSSPKITVDYYGHLNFDKPYLHTDVFFRQESCLKDESILMAFKLPRDPLNKNKLELITTHGMSAVVTNPLASQVAGSFYFQHWPQKRMALPHIREILKRLSQKGSWLKDQCADFSLQFNYWYDFFSRTNTKIYVTWYKYDGSHAVQAQALRQAGGILAMYQRAFEEFPSPETATCADVFFAFSKLSAQVARGSASRIPYIVITGYGGDYRFKYLRPFADEIRARLHHRGAKKIMAYFDEGSAADDRWHTGHTFMQEPYKFLLEKVLLFPWFGLVIKPKVSKTLRERLGPIAELLKEAEATGRCEVIKSDMSLHEGYPPSLAALAADVAVQGCMAAGTAGIETALSGTPTLMVDPEGCPNSCFYRLGPRTAFKNWDSMWNICLEHWQTSEGLSGFGDWSGMIEEFDPFRDGLAAHRTGTYMKWLMEGFKSGLNREENLMQAAQHYVDQWGEDKIIKIN